MCSTFDPFYLTELGEQINLQGVYSSMMGTICGMCDKLIGHSLAFCLFIYHYWNDVIPLSCKSWQMSTKKSGLVHQVLRSVPLFRTKRIFKLDQSSSCWPQQCMRNMHRHTPQQTAKSAKKCSSVLEGESRMWCSLAHSEKSNDKAEHTFCFKSQMLLREMYLLSLTRLKCKCSPPASKCFNVVFICSLGTTGESEVLPHDLIHKWP